MIQILVSSLSSKGKKLHRIVKMYDANDVT